MQNWMYSLSDSLETSEEFDLSLKLLYTFLGSDEVLDRQAMGKEMAEALTNFIMTSIAPRKASIAFFVKLHLRCFNMRTTSNVESESSTIKKHPLGPRPFHGIDRSCAAMSTILSRQMNTREMSNDVSYQYNILPRRFVRVREIKIVEQFKEGNDGIIRDSSPMLCLVCSCGYFKRFGITCRHVYAVHAPQSDHAANPLSTDDAIVSWRKDYLHYHSRDGNLTDLYDIARETEAPGTCARKKHTIDFLWPHHHGNCILFHQQFLSQHNQNSKSAILCGTKWNPRPQPSRRSDFNNIDAEVEDSGLPLSRKARMTSMTTVAPQEDESSVLLWFYGGVSGVLMACSGH